MGLLPFVNQGGQRIVRWHRLAQPGQKVHWRNPGQARAWGWEEEVVGIPKF